MVVVDVDVLVDEVLDVEVLDVDVEVVVEVLTEDPNMGNVTELVHTPFDFTLTCVAASGTNIDVYPATNEALGTFTSKAFINPSASEYKSKGPVSVPAKDNVINTVCGIYNLMFYCSKNNNK